jgi:hypothetical protein
LTGRLERRGSSERCAAHSALMETLVIDASIAVKWVVEEEGTEAALGLRSAFRFLAPELSRRAISASWQPRSPFLP